jgi:hypothetical protein
MKKQALLALALASLAGTAIAAPRETQTNAGPFSTHAPVDNAANTEQSLNFTLTGYTPIGVRVQSDLTSIAAATWASEASVQLTDPSGEIFVISLAPLVAETYTAITGSQGALSFPTDYVPSAGTWVARFYDTFNDATGGEESSVANFSISMEDGVGTRPTTAGNLTPVDGSATTASGTVEPNGVTWYRLNVGTDASFDARRYLDITTSTTGAGTVLLVYDNNGGYTGGVDFDRGPGLGSFLSFGYGFGTATGDLGNGGAPTFSNGGDGDLLAGTYYVAVLSDDVNAIEGGFALDLFNLIPLTPAPGTSFTMSVTQGPAVLPPRVADPVVLGPRVTREFALGGVGSPTCVKWYTITPTSAISAANNRFLDIITNGSGLGDTQIAMFDNAGALLAEDDDDGTGFQSFLSFGASSGRNYNGPAGDPIGDGRDGELAAGQTYWLAAAQFPVTFGAGFDILFEGVGAGGGLRTTFFAGAPGDPLPPAAAPTAEALGNIAADRTAEYTPTAPGQIKWYTFNTPAVTRAGNRYLDIHTNNATMGDTEIGIYRDSGVLVVADDDDGVGLKTLISFGVGSGQVLGDGAGGTEGIDGELTAGLYYMAVGPFNVTYGADFGAGSTGTSVDPVTINFLAGERVVVVTPPSGAINVGTFTGPVQSEESVDTVSTTDAGSVHWMTFNVASDVSAASGLYMDIDTESTTDYDADTVIGVYAAAGGPPRSIDDDDGTGFLSALSYGAVGPRTAIGTGLARNGRDGTLATGQYYMAIIPWTIGFSMGSNFNAAGGTDVGNVTVNFRSNMLGGNGGGGSSPCGPADVAGAGAAPGFDNFLDNNDFIFFIQIFFERAPAADIAGAGASPGSDGAWDNNDFVLFIQTFFDGGAASGCNGNP